MKFIPAPLKGVFLIKSEPKADYRGHFGRVWCCEEAEAHGLEKDFVQVNSAFSHKRGTLRGMHFQKAPHLEAKVIRCTRGSVYDVCVDIRPNSATFGNWYGAELTDDNGTMMYIPKGFAHGYLTLEDNCEVMYLVSEFYHPESEGGLHYNDPQVAISWPVEITLISEKDSNQPLLDRTNRNGS